ncbi:uncharacterized protein LOC144861813 [Branchiostoma floridae x Branchiostoma japonicum]
MSNKERRMLVLLLIILKEAGPTAACSSSCSSWCNCYNRDLTSVPQDLPTNITRLDLVRNAITNLSQSNFLRYKSLTRLDLTSNQISVIQNKTFQDLTSLTFLDLNDNQLTSLTPDTFVGLGALEWLRLDQNKLTTSSLPTGIFVGLGNLTQLYLPNNQLTNLTADIFAGLNYLGYLGLHSNQLTSLPADIFAGLGNLWSLLLNQNKLSSLPADIFFGLGNLRSLWLAGNQLTSLPAGIFAGLGNLQTLRLDQNQLSTLPVDIFDGLDNLQLLRLYGNQLQTLPPMLYDILGSIDVRSDVFYHTVRLDNNPWQCDCRMAPFRQRMNGSYPFEAQVRCAGPANLVGRYLRNVSHENLICEETTPVHSTNTHRVFDSTLNLSYVSSSSTFHPSAKSTSKAPTLSPTSSNTPTAGSNPDQSTVSTSPLLDPSAKSTSNLPTPLTAPNAGSNTGLSTVSTDSAFGFQSTVTESNAGPTGDGIVLSVPILATLCVCLGIFIICTIACGVWCMYKRRSNVTGTGMSSGNNTRDMRLHTVTHADRIRQSISSHSDRQGSQHTYNLPNDDPEYDTIADINQSEGPHQGIGNMQGLDSFSYLVLPPPLPPENPAGPQADAHRSESADAAAHTVGGRDTWTDEAEYDDVLSPSKRPKPGPGQMQQLGSSNDGYEDPSPSLCHENGAHPQAREEPKSHKYENSQVIAAAKDASTAPHGIVYENDDEIVPETERPESHKYENSQVKLPVEAAVKHTAASPRAIVYENDDESVDNQSQTAAAPGADSPNHYEPLRNPSGQQQHTYTSLLPHN